MLYDQYFIDDLKNRADIVRIIQPYAQDLKKKGANWMACCPFHQEKTPSFSVNPSKGFYKCFGCGKGGSVYNFLMEIEGLNFPEAIKRVAEMSGVMLPEPVDDRAYEKGKKKRDEKKQLADQIIELNQIALEFWENELQAKNAKAKAARKYLETRGISDETQKAFRIGFSPDTWDSLLNLLKEKGADEKVIEQSGLVSVNEEKERIFDKFRGRIMFPVLDVNGKPVAFGARAMGDDQPKYLNSPETAAYIKGQNLYGLFQAKEDIRKKKFAILVEGYLDLIALYQFGITNVAASLGTAFTPAQAKLLNRITKSVVINYDGDKAGRAAAQKAIQELLHNQFKIKVFVLPNNQDPDDFIRANGPEAYNDLRGKAKPFNYYIFENAIRHRNLAMPVQRMEVIEELIPYIAAVQIPNERRLFFDEIVRECRVDDELVRNQLWGLVRDGKLVQSSEIKKAVARSVRGKITIAERHLLELLVFDRELRDHILPQLEPSDYDDLPTADLFTAFVAIHTARQDITQDTLLEHIGDDENAVDLAHILLIGEARREKDEPIDRVSNEAVNCVFTLRNMAIANRIMEISRDASLAEQAGDAGLFNQLTYEQIDLEKIRRDLQRRIVQM